MASSMAEEEPLINIKRWVRASPCPLGAGSFGHVSLALNLDDGSLFAVKSTPCPSPASPFQLLSMQHELRILQHLSSPSIVRCFGADFTIANGFPVSHNLFLEYMDGGSLAYLIKRSGGRLEEPSIRHYTRHILEGLSYLHQNGIVHCDLKGQNILLGSAGVKIADFGAAKKLDDDLQKDGQDLRGTPLWMAPEVVQGMGQGFPSDIWSLGCTVVEMIQGRPPFGHITNIVEALYKAASSKEDLPMPEGVTEDARDFLNHCLQRDPKARWTAAKLLQHPFVCGIDLARNKGKHEQPSPRSTLDFLCDESTWEDESNVGIASILPCPLKPMSPLCTLLTIPITEACIPKQTDWITVRRSDAWSAEREMPFMNSLQIGDVHVRKACEVSLEAAEFLRKRRKVG